MHTPEPLTDPALVTFDAVNTMTSVVAIAALVSLIWFAVDYSLAYTPGNGLLGGSERLWFSGLSYLKDVRRVAVSHVAPNVPESVHAMFQLTFATITAPLIVGLRVSDAAEMMGLDISQYREK